MRSLIAHQTFSRALGRGLHAPGLPCQPSSGAFCFSPGLGMGPLEQAPSLWLRRGFGKAPRPSIGFLGLCGIGARRGGSSCRRYPCHGGSERVGHQNAGNSSASRPARAATAMFISISSARGGRTQPREPRTSPPRTTVSTHATPSMRYGLRTGPRGSRICEYYGGMEQGQAGWVECPQCHAALDAVAMAQAAGRVLQTRRQGSNGGRPRTVAHVPDYPQCPCADCRRKKKLELAGEAES